MYSVSKPGVRFFFNVAIHSLRSRKHFKKHIDRIFSSEGFRLKALNIIFTSDRELLKLNQTYLGHNTYTDVITFDLSETDSEIEAEIYISVDRVKENAEKLGVSFKNELCRVIIHGVLHLCGYTDKTQNRAKVMREREDYYLSKLQ